MTPRDESGRAAAVLLAALLSITAAASIPAAATQTVTFCTGDAPNPAPPTTSPLKHLFILIKENHAFENYFGTLPGVVGYPPNATLPRTLAANASTIHPFPLNRTSTTDLPHDHRSETVDVNGGRMNLFVAEAAADGAQDPTAAAGYYTSAQIPQYFAYARAYSLGDEFFSGILGPTQPNRIFDLAATNDGVLGDTPPSTPLTVPTILDQLTAARIPWAYDYTGNPTNLTPFLFSSIADQACVARYVVPFTELGSQLRSPTPPAVTFIDPSHDALGVSEHPPDNVTVGAQWTAGIVNAIFTSPLAATSAVLLFYDEAGGYWDPVPPPARGPYGDGIRVPFLVLSPYTPAGHVVDRVLDPASVLGFIDGTFGLPPLNDRVAAAPSLAPFFNFSAPRRAPLLLPTPFSIDPTSAVAPAPPHPAAARPPPTLGPSAAAPGAVAVGDGPRRPRPLPKGLNPGPPLASPCRIDGSPSGGRSRSSSSPGAPSSRSR